jgi:hypothetical protein
MYAMLMEAQQWICEYIGLSYWPIFQRILLENYTGACRMAQTALLSGLLLVSKHARPQGLSSQLPLPCPPWIASIVIHHTSDGVNLCKLRRCVMLSSGDYVLTTFVAELPTQPRI